ncbi:MAG: AzlC family ABC transporter permease [Pseudomonadales bacterium]
MSQAPTNTSILNTQIVFQGFRALLPLCFFVAVFGAAFAVAAQQIALSDSAIVLMSAALFAGASQFAALEFWGDSSALLPLCLTVLAINARHLLMGATLYPQLKQLPVLQRYAVMILASDANWALANAALQRGEAALGLLLGGGLALWLFWVIGTGAGLYLGSVLAAPHALGLDMVMSCFLLCMLLKGERDVRTACIWLVAGTSSLLAYTYLPDNSHVIVGTLCGGLLGALWQEDTQ